MHYLIQIPIADLEAACIEAFDGAQWIRQWHPQGGDLYIGHFPSGQAVISKKRTENMKALLPILLTILSLFNSKKGLAMLAGVVVSLLGLAGVIADPNAVITILTPIVAFIVGQGVADIGQGRVRAEAKAVEAMAAKTNILPKS